MHPALPNGLIACETEPIHIPGAIQPFGILLTVDRDRLVIHNASVNTFDFWGIAAGDLLGKSFATLLTQTDVDELGQYLVQDKLSEQQPLCLALSVSAPQVAAQWYLSAHEYDGCLILELEPNREFSASAMDVQQKLRVAVHALQACESLQQLCQAAVEQMQRMTDFDRVMLYRFSQDWHGVVIAEACRAGMDRYLGHHFPASDIPAQARAVFLQNWLRMIPDVDYIPVAVLPNSNPQSGTPLNLTKSLLRSVSPIHLEYLRNMQVKASLTVPLIDEGKLWGLIACHHAQPLVPSLDGRLGAKMIGQLVSSQVRIKQSLEELRQRARLREIGQALEMAMKREENTASALLEGKPTLFDLIGAGGVALRLGQDSPWQQLGTCPPPTVLDCLANWLTDTRACDAVFQTNHLGRLLAPAAPYENIASGVLAISIPKAAGNFIFWFRPEVATTVTWAGNPQKVIDDSDPSRPLHPRMSFASWKEVVRGTAVAWKTAEIDAALELRSALIAVDLKKEYHRERAARALAERVSREKETMVNIVAHDLRTPLTIVKLCLESFTRDGKGFAPYQQEMLRSSLRAVDTIEQLAADILEIAKIDAGQLTLRMQPQSAAELLEDTARMFAPLAAQRDVRVNLRLPTPDASINCDRGRIDQVMSNLIGNAIKFTPRDGVITLSAAKENEDVVFCVADTGIGIAPKHLPKIFERFWQKDSHGPAMGAGLGLSIAKSIIEQHQGRIWAYSMVGQGSQFYFTLPCACPHEDDDGA